MGTWAKVALGGFLGLVGFAIVLAFTHLGLRDRDAVDDRALQEKVAPQSVLAGIDRRTRVQVAADAVNGRVDIAIHTRTAEAGTPPPLDDVRKIAERIAGRVGDADFASRVVAAVSELSDQSCATRSQLHDVSSRAATLRLTCGPGVRELTVLLHAR
jgi:hypothetical protein